MRKTYVLLLLLVFSLTSYFIISCRHEPPAVLVNYIFTYGPWSACTNGIETRTYTSNPNDGTPPADSILRTCTDYTFTYGLWSACTNGIQTRTFTSNPNGGTPLPDSVSRTCTAPPTNCTFTYSAWSSCVTGHQARTVIGSSPLGCTGTPPADSLSRTCTAPTTCTFTYSAWSTCVTGHQARTVIGSSPVGCTGTPPADSLSRTCTCPTITVSTTPINPTSGANGSISASATGGLPPYTYSINGGAYGSSTFPSLSSGIYSISAKDANSCTGTSNQVTLACPTITVSGTPTSSKVNCVNNSILITASNGVAPYTYSKDGTTFQSSATLTPLAGGTYTITAKDAKGCTGTNTVTISAPATVHFATDVKPTINSYCGSANISCHNHNNNWTTYSNIVGSSSGSTWSSSLLTFIGRIRGTSSTGCVYSSGNHNMPPTSATAWNTFIQGAFTNWVNQGYPNN